MSDEKSKQAVMQQMATVYQLLNGQLEQIRQQGNAVQKNMLDLDTTVLALHELKPTDILIPLGSGVFVKGKAEQTDTVLVESGAGVVLKKSIPDALKHITIKKKEMEKIQEQLLNEETKITNQIRELAAEINKME